MAVFHKVALVGRGSALCRPPRAAARIRTWWVRLAREALAPQTQRCPGTRAARAAPRRKADAGALGRYVREVIVPTCALAHGTPSTRRARRRPKSHGAPGYFSGLRRGLIDVRSTGASRAARAAPRKGGRGRAGAPSVPCACRARLNAAYPRRGGRSEERRATLHRAQSARISTLSRRHAFLGQLVKCARISLAVSRLPQPQPQGIVTPRGRPAPTLAERCLARNICRDLPLGLILYSDPRGGFPNVPTRWFAP
jgi:hypothetical protein